MCLSCRSNKGIMLAFCAIHWQVSRIAWMRLPPGAVVTVLSINELSRGSGIAMACYIQ
jgi:hypothetical protein